MCNRKWNTVIYKVNEWEVNLKPAAAIAGARSTPLSLDRAVAQLEFSPGSAVRAGWIRRSARVFAVEASLPSLALDAYYLE